jgi:hypothetical protein
MAAFKDTLGPAWTVEMEAAWTRIVKALIGQRG